MIKIIENEINEIFSSFSFQLKSNELKLQKLKKLNEMKKCLEIHSIQNSSQNSLQKSFQNSFDEIIKIINEKSNCEIICNEECIPHYIQLKNHKEIIYFSNEFIKEFNVNEKIKNLIEMKVNQFEIDLNESSEEIQFPTNYLTKRFDYEN